MVKALLGKKVGMTRIFGEKGRMIPVTLVEAGPCPVVQRKNSETDGYEAVQLGFGEKKLKRVTKPMQGHYAKADAAPARVLREFPVEPDSELNTGDKVTVDMFEAGDRVDVAGFTKGRGFAGVIKRHGFKGGPASHGSNHHREPGSVGQAADPSRVFKNMKLPGRMGNKRVTTQNLEVVYVDAEKNVIAVRGAIPGANGGFVEVRKSVKGS